MTTEHPNRYDRHQNKRALEKKLRAKEKHLRRQEEDEYIGANGKISKQTPRHTGQK